MKQPPDLDDSFRIPRPVRSGTEENARPTLVIVLALLVALAVFAVAVVAIAKIVIVEGSPT